MSAMIDEDRVAVPRRGLAGGFADGRSGGEPAEMWRRFWFTLGALLVLRLGSYLPLPGLDPLGMRAFSSTHQTGLLGLLDMLAGGDVLRRLSILALGIMPYISAFIIVQLISHIVPRLRSLAAEGDAGRRRLNQYARILTVALAALQAFGVAMALESSPGLVMAPGFLFEAATILALAAGAIFVMWLAEQITVRGVGDGVLVILACGFLSHLPFALSGVIEWVKMGDLEGYWLLVTLLVIAAVVALVVLVERAERRIPIHDPGGEVGIGGPAGSYAHLVLKVNPTGIFAPLAASVLAKPLWDLVTGSTGHDTPFLGHLASTGLGYVLVDSVLIILFAIYFGLAIFDPEEIAKKLTDAGGWIPGFHPGENTARYLRRTQAVLALTGAIYLVAACVLPELIYVRFYLPLPFSGLELFLLAWVMVRIIERMRPIVRS